MKEKRGRGTNLLPDVADEVQTDGLARVAGEQTGEIGFSCFHDLHLEEYVNFCFEARRKERKKGDAP